MKVTVGDVTNNKVNVRDYMSVDEETGRIFVDVSILDTVLIDRSAEWDELEWEIKHYRKAIERAEKELLDKTRPLDFSVSTALDILIEALEGECIHCNGKGFNGLDYCPQCNQLEGDSE